MRHALLFLAAIAAASAPGPETRAPHAPAEDEGAAIVRVMTYNLWIGGERSRLPLAKSAAVIEAAQADIVGIQEADGEERPGGIRPDNAAVIAEKLGWHHAAQANGRAIISRFPIEEVTPRRQGAAIRLPSGQRLYCFNIHFSASPYQPYQLLRIPYGDAPFLDTPEELAAAAHAARGAEVRALLHELLPRVQAGHPVVLTGDFNEPSHRDWTPEAAEAGIVPMAVQFPATRRVEEAGMTDAYRAVHPDPVTHPGWTWTPITAEDDPEDRHDRIDLIFTGPGIEIRSVAIVGEKSDRADIVVRPYPSDHRAVAAEIEVRKTPAQD